MLTKKQRKQIDRVFDAPLSDREKLPKGYNPPDKLDGETMEMYLARLDAYNAGYYSKKRG